ncbi:hypothetical protein P879_01363 [Paragonimus westermani]|uniref:EF-hand domain-containing protein n=1 Tax=Paragonimus westermani TaxID=34504 RepID=A0A8T0DXI9_9TREM|nr:hypothetical protein P879_01363 [Paragonimus westermani]
MVKPSEVKQILDCLDKSKNGKIDRSEFQAFMDESDCPLDKQKVQQYFDMQDTNHDGEIDLQELTAFLNQE